TILSTTLPSYYTSKNIMSKHAHEIMDNISAFAIDKSKSYMNSAVDAVKLTKKLATQKILDKTNNKAMELYFFEQLQLNDEFSAMYFGKENGDFIMVLRNKNGFMSRFINNDEKNHREVTTIFYDKTFKVLKQNNENRKYDPRQRPWYKLAQKNKELIWTDPYVFFTLKQPGITTATPFYNTEGILQGVLGVDIEISKLSKFIANLKISKNSKVFIIDKSLKIVTFPNLKTIQVDEKTLKTRLLKIDEINDAVALKSYTGYLEHYNKNERKKESTFSFELENKKYFAKFVPFEMNNLQWTIGMYVPENDYLGTLQRNQNANIAWMLIIGIISLIISFVISQAISKPIARLQDMAHNLKKLNLDTKNVEPSIFLEIDETINSFNQMKASLLSAIKHAEKKQQIIKEKNNQMIETKQLLQEIIDNAPIRIFWKDKNSRYLGANKLFIKDFGLTDIHELIGKKGSDFSKLKDTNSEQNDIMIMNNDCSKLNYVETLNNDDGSRQIINTSKVPLHDYLGEVTGIVGVYDDITHQVNTQNELKEKEYLMLHQSKLAAMGEMIGNIAHQWRQPLTIVSSLVMSMQLKLEMDMFDEKFFDKKLTSINNSLQHMSKTIDDFREFFKPQKEKKFFNLNYIYEKITNLIGEEFRTKNIEIITDLQDIEIKGFDNELVQVLINIINNAIYAIELQEVDRKLIFLSVFKRQNFAVIEIQDNGGGIKEEIINKIFEPYFTTKHKSQGTGIGLYMSSQIIKKHMTGEMVVENKQYEYEGISYNGALFTITLPFQ
ncbi:MAG: PAS domain S-box protein, partial [Campylobacteraceae bacterium]|nr:PAS domain S-box protein [Campylobacteraceae bacterium]